MRMGLGMGLGVQQQATSGPTYHAATNTYIAKVADGGGTVVDAAYCDNWIRFLNGDTVSIGGTDYTLSESIWRNTKILVSARGGLKLRTAAPDTYLVTAYNMCGDNTTDLTNAVENQQPLIVAGVPRFNFAMLNNTTGLTNLLSDIAEIFCVVVKNWVSTEPAGAASNPRALANTLATYPRIIVQSGEMSAGGGNNKPRISAQRNDSSWRDITGTNIDANARNILTAYLRYNQEKGTIWINGAKAAADEGIKFAGEPRNTPATASTSIKWGDENRNNGDQEMMLVVTNASVKNYTSICEEILAFTTAIEAVL